MTGIVCIDPTDDIALTRAWNIWYPLSVNLLSEDVENPLV